MDAVNGQHTQTTSRRRRLKPPSVDVALQHTPLTSIVPFDAEIIPFPQSQPSSTLYDAFEDDERETARRLLRDLDATTKSGVTTRSGGYNIEKTLKEVQHLLNGENLTQFKFKAPPKLQTPPSSGRKSKASAQNKTSPIPLGAFSQLVLNSTNVSYRYPTPASIESPSPKSRSSTQPSPSKLSTTINPSSLIINIPPASHNRTAASSAAANGPGITNGVTPSQGPSVSIPSLPVSSDPNAYQSFASLDQTILAREENEEEALVHSRRGYQDRAEQHLAALYDLIDEIFAAEDSLEPDTSGAVSSQASKFFAPARVDGSDVFCLKAEPQRRLDDTMQKAINFGRFQDVPVEYLIRLQRLCAVSLRRMDGLELDVLDVPSESALDEWGDRLDSADDALLASRCLLRIMVARSNDMQLCPEELIQEILNNLKKTLEACVIPVAEITDARSGTERIQALLTRKGRLGNITRFSGRILKLLGDLLLLTDISENAITTIEFLAIKLIFVENAPFEKDSVLDLQKFQVLRQSAMDALAKLFLRRPEQRQGIFAEILSSLEKLPVTRQSARQFKIIDGKPIQLVSALIMQLVQTSSIHSIERSADTQTRPELREDGDGSTDDDTDQRIPPGKAMFGLSIRGIAQFDNPLDSLSDVAMPLYETAQRNATYVAKYLVERALKSTKSGDQPYRNLLDIFAEDFISVLGNTDWPAAEMLLTSLLSHFIGLAENDKSQTPAKTMALDLMGVLGSGIADLQNNVRQRLQKNEVEEQWLANLAENVLAGNADEAQLYAVAGPFRAVVEFLQYRVKGELQLKSAVACYLSQWARAIKMSFDNARKLLDADPADEISPWACKDVALWLRAAILGETDVSRFSEYDSVSTVKGRLCYALTILTMPFGKAMRRILHILVGSMSSPHATVRSRSLKSIVQLVEKDSSLLDGGINIMGHISQRLSDTSPLVRESVLGFIAKVPVLKADLEGDACNALIAISADEAVGIRKRAIKHLKDFYLGNKDQTVRSGIADAILQRVQDTEDSVRALARLTVEEIWFAPFSNITDGSTASAQERQELRRHASLLVATSQRNDAVLTVLESVFRSALKDASKNQSSTFTVCKSLVTIMFDGIIDNESMLGVADQQSIFRSLTVFAKAEPRLFTSSQMVTLQPYIKNLDEGDNFQIYRSVIVIFRCVLPVLSSLPEQFLGNVQSTLLSTVSRLGKLELDEVTQCLWIIDGVLKNTIRLVKTTLSSMCFAYRDRGLGADATAADWNRIRRLIRIIGSFGKACNLEAHLRTYKTVKELSALTSKTVSGLMVEVVMPFTGPSRPLPVRQTALESICQISQAWPRNFLDPQVSKLFQSVFKQDVQELEYIVLTGFKAFYDVEEQRSQASTNTSADGAAASGADRLGSSMTVNDSVKASKTIAEQYLSDILRISTASYDSLAMLATEIVVSINRQGLVHPKECGPKLVALSTSPNERIAKIAAAEHHSMLLKYESMLEKEYIKAVEEAFEYQRTTCEDDFGVIVDSAKPKLKAFFDAVRAGSVKSRQKLYNNICTRLNVDLTKLPSIEKLEVHVQYAGFILSNLSLIDYARIDEILHLIAGLEKRFLNTGTALTQSIEATLGIAAGKEQGATETTQMNGLSEHPQASAPYTTPRPDIEALTLVARVMTLMWETRAYLRRTWSLQKYGPNATKVKAAAKDLARAPARSSASDPAKLLVRFVDILTPLKDFEQMQAECRAFVELLAVDNELKVASEDEALGADGYDTPSDGAEATDARGAGPASGGSKGRKRKWSMSATPTPKKPKVNGQKRKTGDAWHDDDSEASGWD